MFRPRLRTTLTRLSLAIAGVAAALTCLAPAEVLANGRFPQSVSVKLQPGNDQTMLVGTTWGLLISKDGGQTFQWVCEDAVGYTGTYDPEYLITEGGDFFATTYEGLAVSRDQGCTWENVGGLLSEQWAEDVELGPAGEIWVATASADLANDIFVSTDGGTTFEPRNLSSATAFWLTVKVSPQDGQRLYVTGYSITADTSPVALVYRTSDGGASWDPLTLTDVQLGVQARFELLQVAPTSADTVFAAARKVVNNGRGDALYRSTDAGASWAKVLETQDRLSAFVIRQSGDVVAGTVADGVYVSSDGGASFPTHLTLPQMACATETSTGDLLACGANWDPDLFALGRSTDLQSWDKIMRFSEIKSAYSCSVGTTQHDTCEVLQWPSQCERFRCNVVEADAGPVAPIDASPAPPVTGSKGCCDAGAGLTSSSMALTLLSLLAVVLIGRRRKTDRPRQARAATARPAGC